MARSNLVLLALSGLLAPEVSGVSVVTDTKAHIVRKQAPETSLEEEGAGEDEVSTVAEAGHHGSGLDDVHGFSDRLCTDASNCDFIEGNGCLEDTDASPCNKDDGTAKDNCGCLESHHQVIMDQDLCKEAAKTAGATTNDNFLVSGEETDAASGQTIDKKDRRPQGCFKAKCDPSDAASGFCFFFNSKGSLPLKCAGETAQNGAQPKVEGIQMCKRNRYEYGTVNGNGGCPDLEGTGDFGVIESESLCVEAAQILGACKGTDFSNMVVTAKNGSRYNDFPDGCFLDTGNLIKAHHKCVYFNAKPGYPNNIDENWGAPSSPVGTPVCNVTSKYSVA